ncbi:MAG: hypothetical protein QM699_01160 [Amaricoccus sp.]|uniref:hypothetical protein n=1 Tax=Amaricoccus sp. TaxID=1872485 RepID=UPI0039E36BCC
MLIYSAAPDGRVNESLGVCTALTNLMQTLGLASSGVGLWSLAWLIAIIMAANGVYALADKVGI